MATEPSDFAGEALRTGSDLLGGLLERIRVLSSNFLAPLRSMLSGRPPPRRLSTDSRLLERDLDEGTLLLPDWHVRGDLDL
jgi:hypothetical protein